MAESYTQHGRILYTTKQNPIHNKAESYTQKAIIPYTTSQKTEQNEKGMTKSSTN
jgi:hypothetical protein